MSNAIVVLGMHRSGTSAVARQLHLLGLDFGKRLMVPDSNNPKGYYEHRDIVNLHDRLLLRLKTSWDDVREVPELSEPSWHYDPKLIYLYESVLKILNSEFSPENCWVLKDPRLSLLAPWWENIWKLTNKNPLFVILLRSPDEVAASLAARNSFSLQKSYLLWLKYYLKAEENTRGFQRFFIHYGDFLGDWQGALEPIIRAANSGSLERKTSLPMGAPSTPSHEGPDLSLRHFTSQRGTDGTPPHQNPESEQLIYAASLSGIVFKSISENRPPESWFDQARPEISDLVQSYQASPDRKNDLEPELAALNKITAWYDQEWQYHEQRYAALEALKQRPQPEAVTSKKRKFSFLPRTLSQK